MSDKEPTDRLLGLRERAAAPVVVLAMHGGPPLDFPESELIEFVTLQARVGHGGTGERDQRQRYEELEAKVRSWPLIKKTPVGVPIHGPGGPPGTG